MDDVTKDVEQVVTTVADNVIAEDSAEHAPMDGSNATADATTETKLNGHAAAEDTASSLGREELAAVTADSGSAPAAERAAGATPRYAGLIHTRKPQSWRRKMPRLIKIGAFWRSRHPATAS